MAKWTRARCFFAAEPFPLDDERRFSCTSSKMMMMMIIMMIGFVLMKTKSYNDNILISLQCSSDRREMFRERFTRRAGGRSVSRSLAADQLIWRVNGHLHLLVFYNSLSIARLMVAKRLRGWRWSSGAAKLRNRWHHEATTTTIMMINNSRKNYSANYLFKRRDTSPDLPSPICRARHARPSRLHR